MAKKLFQIFGPLFLAAFILIAFLISPIKLGKTSKHDIHVASLSQSTNVFKGTLVKQEAFSENYVPFMGSSELSRMDAFHPTAMALRYHRDYRPFLLGAAGSQSLSHYFGLQGVNKQLTGKKAVFIISPQWFVKKGANSNAFALYYSNLEAVTWLLNSNNSKMDRIAASRLLDMQAGKSPSILRMCITDVANGKKLNDFERTYLKARYNQLKHEDELFSTLKMKDRLPKINEEANILPAQYNQIALENTAERLGKKNTKNNKFGILNKFYDKKISKRLAELKGSQTDFNYLSSPEFTDFELVLNQFAKDRMNVLFIIPPVNQRWAKYTGLSQSMLRQFSTKINYQLKQQGFNNVLDLSRDGGKRFFMQDTIHLGWYGWLKADQTIAPFLTKRQPTPKYKINNFFYSKKWQKINGQQLENLVNK